MEQLSRASEAQEEALGEVQKTLRRLSFSGKDEAGQVEVRVSGDGRIREVSLDPSLKDAKLEDLAVAIAEAANDALQQARSGAIEKLADRGAELGGAADLLARQRS